MKPPQKKEGSELEIITTVSGTSKVHSVDYSPDGKTIVTCEEYGIRLWDGITGELLKRRTYFLSFN